MTKWDNKKDSEVVAEARDMISNPENWVRGDWCVGEPKEGVAMCAEGAVEMSLGLLSWQPYKRATAYGRTGQWNKKQDSTQSLRDRHSQARRIEKEMVAVALDMFSEGEGTPLERKKFDRGMPWSLNEFNDAEHETPRVKVIHHEDVMAIFDKTLAKMQEEGR